MELHTSVYTGSPKNLLYFLVWTVFLFVVCVASHSVWIASVFEIRAPCLKEIVALRFLLDKLLLHTFLECGVHVNKHQWCSELNLRVCRRLLFVYETFANAFGTVTLMKPFFHRCIQTLCLTVDVQILLKLVFLEHVKLQ